MNIFLKNGPTVFIKDGNKQKIILQDRKKINYEISTTPEKVDEYIKSRDNVTKVGVGTILTTLGSTLLVGLANYIKTKSFIPSLMIGIYGGFLGFGGCYFYIKNKANKLNDKFITENSKQ
jgi:hypothetical protein